ncbi:SdpI family protein [Listeria floridensis]|uniref:SdpI family protein n=1 Tax=Listeria floridensis TaxID=1494962 RepID=UPI0011EA5237
MSVFFTPQDTSKTFTYRTKASLKSERHFKAAHQYLGLLWIALGAFSILLYLVMLFIPLSFIFRSSIYLLIVILLIFLTIIQTEKYLAKL